MLKYLKISGLAIIDKVEVEFRDGFNVLTGETGAGKSILIGAWIFSWGLAVHPTSSEPAKKRLRLRGYLKFLKE